MSNIYKQDASRAAFNSLTRSQTQRRFALPKSSLIVALLLAATSSVFAQTTPATGAVEEEIIVSASRISRPGFTAPTPTTVVSVEEIQARAALQIADVLKDLPSSGPNGVFGASAGILTLNLRNLNSGGLTVGGRSLFLIDGRRAVGSSRSGLVDTNQVPTSLVERIDVITGGASAAWGSDAVAGVASVVFKKKIEGLEGSLQFGESGHHDNKSKGIALAYGSSFAGGKGEVMVAFDYTKNYDGATIGDRNWGTQRQGYTTRVVNGLIYTNVPTFGLTLPNFTTGGVLLAAQTNAAAAPSTTFGSGLVANGTLGSVAGNNSIVFGNGGVAQLLTRSTDPVVTVNGVQVGGTSSANFAVGGYGAWFGDKVKLTAQDTARHNFYLRSTYDISPKTTASFEMAFTKTNITFDQGELQLPGGVGNSIVVGRNNPYLLATGVVLPANVLSVSVGKLATDLPNATQVNDIFLRSFAFGLKGSLDDNALGKNWSWRANASHAESLLSLKTINNIVRNKFRASLNAVVQNGVIVCNPASVAFLSLTADERAACVPANPFGPNSFSKQAIAFFEGKTEERPHLQLDEFYATTQFEPFSTWAGTVSALGGVEWRKEQMDSKVDDVSARPVVISDFNITDTGGFMYINPKGFIGKPVTVKEYFGETIIPLLKDVPWLGKAFDIDAAARSTNYSLSGKVNSWKVSGVYTPIAGMLLRATKSRDIRAPSQAELFNGFNTQTGNITTGNSATADPLQPTKTYTYNVVQAGNTDLKPEIGDTKTLGFSWSPEAVSGLSMSVDYYQIKITNAIGALNQQTIVDGCGNGVLATGTTFPAGSPSSAALCNLIVRLGGPNTATDIVSIATSVPINGGYQLNRGVDYEIAYRLDLNKVANSLSGNMNFRLLANRLDAGASQSVPGGAVTVSTLGAFASPRWRGTATANYRNGPLSLNVQGTYTSGTKNLTVGTPSATAAVANTFSDESTLRIASRWYLNMGAQYIIYDKSSQQIQIFGNVRNVQDRDPPVGYSTALNGSPFNATPAFDVIGRTFIAGVRFNY